MHAPPPNSAFKMSIICRSRGHEAQIHSETKVYFETPHVVSYFINGLVRCSDLKKLATSNRWVKVKSSRPQPMTQLCALAALR